jgi:polyisoprenyl-teichoic acid--peptidoglycan teichoic acid transferase
MFGMKRTLTTVFLIFLVILLLMGIFYASFFIWKTHTMGKKITLSINNDASLMDTLKSFTSDSGQALRTDDQGRLNMLLLGIAGKGKPGQFLTDTIIVASIDTKTNQVALLSIPRDLYYQDKELGFDSKLNTIYPSALRRFENEKEAADTIKRATQKITGIDIHYYVVVNFDGFEKFIDAIGGVHVMNERDILDTRYPGPNYSYETFSLSKGFHNLDGKTALKYARVRHGDPEGDFGRAKRQQQIMQAAKNKIFSTRTFLNVSALNDLFNTIGDNVRTDISPQEFESFLSLTKNLDTNNINTVVLTAWDKDSLLKVSHMYWGGVRAFVLVPRVGNFTEIHELAKNLFDLNTIKRRREEINQEDATIAIINDSDDKALPAKIKELLREHFSYKNVIVLGTTKNQRQETTIAYDLTSGQKPFTLDELIKKLPAQASYELPESYLKTIENTNPHIVIVLGKDLVERYNMEEASIEEYNQAVDTNEYSEFIDKTNKH